MITVGIIGNPNVGKTELFNRLTGEKLYVANWPGVTVEKKVGKFAYNGEKIELVDLPGTYSLTARAIDELIARNYIVEDKPDVVINIVDASNLERNLYLTILLLELEANVVIALNMWDIAKSKGYKIDVGKLSQLLGVPVIPTVAITGEGVQDLKDAIVKVAKRRSKRKIVMSFGKEIESWIKQVEDLITANGHIPEKYPPRWLAIKLIERDEDVRKRLEKLSNYKELMEVARWTN